VSRFDVDSTVFSEELLKKKRLAVVPGVSFGDCAEGWIRITFASDEVTLMEGVKRLGEFAHSEYGLTNVVSPVT
jgi:aminotransferase